jgi:hypothetical protein
MTTTDDRIPTRLAQLTKESAALDVSRNVRCVRRAYLRDARQQPPRLTTLFPVNTPARMTRAIFVRWTPVAIGRRPHATD